VLPHGYPFRFLERSPAGSVTLLWTVNGALARGAAEAPAFLAVEMMAQAALVALPPPAPERAAEGAEPATRGGLLAGLEDVRLNAPLRAGDEVRAEAAVLGRFGRLVKARVLLVRGDETVAEAVLLLALEGDPA
jgi:hypothetical protein